LLRLSIPALLLGMAVTHMAMRRTPIWASGLLPIQGRWPDSEGAV